MKWPTSVVVLSAAAVALSLATVGGSPTPLPPTQLAASRSEVPVRLGSAGQYQKELSADSSEIASHLGHGLRLPIKAVVNTKQLEGDVPAYTLVYDSSGSTTGVPASCKTFINPSYDKEDAAYQKLALIHELFHCYEAMDYPTVAAFQAAPGWLIEGEAEWVGATLAPTELPVWNAYLTGLSTSLFARSYDAIGFYAHMTNSGEDTWHLLDPMLKAGSSAAAYNVAASKTVRLTWASSLARQSSFGKGWQTSGPGITSATVHPGIHEVVIGTTITGNVAPYTNALVEFRAASDIVDISASTPYSRLHLANDTEDDNLTAGPNAFCVNNCDACPQVEALPKLPLGTQWLAVTGDSAGASYTVAGAKATCGPCLVGNWKVTSLSLTTDPGGTHTGGAGTEVDINANGNATGIFTPGAPLTGASGDVKFYGTQIDHYGFPVNTTARSGSFGVTLVAAGASISVDGSPPVGIAASETLSGSYSCVGTGLRLTFPAGGDTFVYNMVPAAPASPPPTTTAKP
jgi:hypothetical protein